MYNVTTINSHHWPASPEVVLLTPELSRQERLDTLGFLFHAEGGFTAAMKQDVAQAFGRAAYSQLHHLRVDAQRLDDYDPNPLLWPAVVHILPEDSPKVWDKREHPLMRQRCAETHPREKDLNARPLQLHYDGLKHVKPSVTGEYLLAMPLALALLTRELHPSTFNFTFDVYTPHDGVVTLTYRELWYECSIVVQALQGGNPSVEYGVNCPRCPQRGIHCLRSRFIEAMRYHTRLTRSFTKSYLTESVELSVPITSRAKYTEGILRALQESTDIAVNVITPARARQAGVLSTMGHLYDGDISLETPALATIEKLHAERAAASAATAALRRDTCGGHSDKDACGLRNACSRWRDGSCTQRWQPEALIAAGVAAAPLRGAERELLHFVCAASQALQNIEGAFRYRTSKGDWDAWIGLRHNNHAVQCVVVTTSEHASRVHYATHSVEDLLRHLASRVAPRAYHALLIARTRTLERDGDWFADHQMWLALELIQGNCGPGEDVFLWSVGTPTLRPEMRDGMPAQRIGYEGDRVVRYDLAHLIPARKAWDATSGVGIPWASEDLKVVKALDALSTEWFYYVPE